MVRRSLLWLSHNRWLGENLPRYRFARAAVRRFMPGEDLEAALGAAVEFGANGMGAVLTRLGENVTSLEVASQVADHYLAVLDRAAERDIGAHISVKLTHLGLDLGQHAAADNLARIVAHAAARGIAVWVDMEGSAYTDRTLEIFHDALGRHGNIGVCVQAYLHRTDRDLEELLARTRAIRLVKGAYNEPPELALTRKRDIDAAFLRLALRLLEGARDHADPADDGAAAANDPSSTSPRTAGMPRPALGTHDVALLDRIIRPAAERASPPGTYEVQMLYGIRVADQRLLAECGHAVRVLISYGPEWFAWFVRRLAERPANLAFVARNILAG